MALWVVTGMELLMGHIIEMARCTSIRSRKLRICDFTHACGGARTWAGTGLATLGSVLWCRSGGLLPARFALTFILSTLQHHGRALTFRRHFDWNDLISNLNSGHIPSGNRFESLLFPHLIPGPAPILHRHVVDLALLFSVGLWGGEEHKFNIVVAESLLDDGVDYVIFPIGHEGIESLFLCGLGRILRGGSVCLPDEGSRRNTVGITCQPDEGFIALTPQRFSRRILHVERLHPTG